MYCQADADNSIDNQPLTAIRLVNLANAAPPPGP